MLPDTILHVSHFQYVNELPVNQLWCSVGGEDYFIEDDTQSKGHCSMNPCFVIETLSGEGYKGLCSVV